MSSGQNFKNHARHELIRKHAKERLQENEVCKPRDFLTFNSPCVCFSKVPKIFQARKLFLKFMNGVEIFSRQTSPAHVVNVRFLCLAFNQVNKNRIFVGKHFAHNIVLRARKFSGLSRNARRSYLNESLISFVVVSVFSSMERRPFEQFTSGQQ